MAIKVLMPALSPTMSEGVINKWLVNIGDTVSAGDILAEIETDKATMEVEAVDEGEITHLIDTTPDKQIAVNSVIALINGSKDEKLEDYNDKDQTLSSEEKNEVSETLKVNTEEDKSVTDPKERERLYWQDDHLRLFGLDYGKKLSAAGFKVTVSNFINELEPKLVERYALPKGEIIYF